MSFPFTLTNGPGNMPDADQLMANFNYLLVSPPFSGSPTIAGGLTVGGILSVTGDLYTTVWTDYSSTSTVVGWASFTSKKIFYKKVGKLVFVVFSIDGTSNATTTTFTLPVATVNSIDTWAAMRTRDNNTDQTYPGAIEIDAGGSTVNCLKDWASNAWTASSRKIINGQFFYQTA